MNDYTEILRRNYEVSQTIQADARRDPQSPYLDKWVGLANGQVVASADDRDELVRRLREVEPDLRKTLCVQVRRAFSKDVNWRASVPEVQPNPAIPSLEALGIDRLSISEKVELIARIWESMPPDAVPELPDSHLACLLRRLARPAALNEALDRDWQLACAINKEARRDPQSLYAGKYVGIANGQIVIVTADRDEAQARLMQTETDPWLRFIFRAGAHPTPATPV